MATMSGNSAVDRRYSCSPEEVRTYQRDGAVHLKGVLDTQDMQFLVAGLEQAHSNPSANFSRTVAKDGGGSTLVDQCPALGNPHLTALLDRGNIAHLAAQLMQVPSAQLILDQLFYKEPGRIVPTPWHQDTPFLCVRGEAMVRVWLSCDPAPSDVTVQVVRGSHRWNVVYATRSEADISVQVGDEGDGFSYSSFGDERLPLIPDVARYRDSFEILRWDVEPGDAIVFHGNVLHGASGRDHHPLPRRTYATMWGGPDLRYYNAGGHAMPTSGAPDAAMPSHGEPIGSYVDAFPSYWQQD